MLDVMKQIYSNRNTYWSCNFFFGQIVHPADLCFKLPDNVSLEEGAMCEPLSVGVHACRRANIGPETNVLIMGAGPIGLVTMLSARAFGAPRIIIVDVDDYRLSVAKTLGADDIVRVSTNIQVLLNPQFRRLTHSFRTSNGLISPFM